MPPEPQRVSLCAGRPTRAAAPAAPVPAGVWGRWYGACEAGAAEPVSRQSAMAVRFRSSGCLWSIVMSVVLTVILNLALRGCTGGGPSW